MFEGSHMLGCAGDDTGTVGFATVSGQDHSTGGGDLDEVGVQAVPDRHGGPGHAGSDGVEVAAERHQCLSRDDPLHHALAVAVPRGADSDPGPVVLRDRAERGGDPPRRWVTHRGHPVEAPRLGAAAEATYDCVEGLDQVWLVLGLGQHRAPLARVRESTHEQVRGIAPPPARRWVGQLDQSNWVSAPGGWSMIAWSRPADAWHGSQCGRSARARRPRAVSYTHLTLPTIYSV